ncbi:type IV toxin-antitoxin system AbiEi family antitoxin domain-containing protein [Rhodopseudomonas sp.]|uniref:type IV toxin-antitoxin system AbiEi family antitoxin domain-containing protein n=1 Tax=Rhodopseudomonas sp. TaxID=1078 RepID=UPI003B3B611F
MAPRSNGKLNYLEKTLPDGLLVDAAWMERHGYSTSLRSQYVKGGWLVQPVRGTFKRPRGVLTWEKAVISLQTLMERSLIVGGRTALELQGFGHYLSPDGPRVVHLHGPEAPPNWLAKLPLNVSFVFHMSQTLFRSEPVTKGLSSFAWDIDANSGQHAEGFAGGAVRAFQTDAEWPLTISTTERAFLEMLDELPRRETFHNVDMIAEGLRTLSPKRMQKLLEDCRSIKVRRLFFWFAERHGHRWLNQINRERVPLGSGKRLLVKRGRLDTKYLITVPEDLSVPG